MIESFFACVNLIDEIDQIPLDRDYDEQREQREEQNTRSSLSHSRSTAVSSPSLSGLVLTDDEIFSLINDFDYDLHSSHRVVSSLMISAKCNDYRPAKAILLTLSTHSLTLFGQIQEALLTCRGIIEVFKAHGKKPSIVMIIYGVILSLLLEESNQILFIESGLHREIASTFKRFLWKFDSNHPLETKNLNLCGWRVVLVAMFSNQNLEARRIFGESSLCENIIQVLYELLLLCSYLSSSLSSSLSPLSSCSSQSLSSPPLSTLLNLFVVSCCGSLMSLSRDYETNFQRIAFSSFLSSFSVIITFNSFLEEILRPSLRMQYSLLTDDSWNILLLTQQYFFSSHSSPLHSPPSVAALVFPPPPPSPSGSPSSSPTLSNRSQQSNSPLSQSIQIFLLKFTSSHEYYKSIVSLALTDIISFLQSRESSSNIDSAFSPHYSHLTTALEIFQSLVKYQHTETLKLNAQLLLSRYNYTLQTNSLYQIQNEIEEITSKYQSDLSVSTELSLEYSQKIVALNSLHSELTSLQQNLNSIETEHQHITQQLQQTQEITTEQIHKYQEMELEQVKTVAAIMNERARVELELDEISYKHKSEINKIQDIFSFSSISPSSSSSISSQKTMTQRRPSFPDQSTSTSLRISPALCVTDDQDERETSLSRVQNESSGPQQIQTGGGGGVYDRNQTSSVLNRMRSLLTSSTTSKKKIPEAKSSRLNEPPPLYPPPAAHFDQKQYSPPLSFPLPPLVQSEQQLSVESIESFPPPPLPPSLDPLEDTFSPPVHPPLSPPSLPPPPTPYFTFLESERRPPPLPLTNISTQNEINSDSHREEISKEKQEIESVATVDREKILKLTALYSKKKNND